MWLRSTRAQEVCVSALDLVVQFAEGEEMRTEISAKFRLPGLRDELARSGFTVIATWTDAAGDFALTLARLA
jgi:L-histidine N-alpha-methyltransferase